jgi:hypothetical protein
MVAGRFIKAPSCKPATSDYAPKPGRSPRPRSTPGTVQELAWIALGRDFFSRAGHLPVKAGALTAEDWKNN